jgi:hypothetical protein
MALLIGGKPMISLKEALDPVFSGKPAKLPELDAAKKQILIQTWGPLGLGTIRVRPGNLDADKAAVRSIERRTGMVCITRRHEGNGLDRAGKILSTHWHVTMGNPALGGGYCVGGELWFKIDAVRNED